MDKEIKETASFYTKEIMRVYNSPVYQIFMDGMRIAVFIVALLIFMELINNIEQVKILMNDPCRLCENKTGAVCMGIDRIEDGVKIIEKKIPIYPELNTTKLNEQINGYAKIN